MTMMITMTIMMIAFVFIFGLLIGSFLNVCIYRIPREEEIVYTPSHCMSCGTRIRWFDLLPVISYLLLKGKCRSCKQKLSLQYPAVEFVNGLAYVGIYLIYGFNKDLIIYCALFSILVVVSLIDYSHQIIPNGLVIALLILGLIHLAFNLDQWLTYLIGFFAVSLILFIIAIITRGNMGGGDIKLMAAAGLLIGWKYILLALMLASILGSVIGLTLMALKVITRKQMIPFGPFLSAGIFIAALYGEHIIEWYLGLMY